MKSDLYRSLIALVLLFSTFQAFAQQPTANERVTPYTANFGYGSNMGYYANGWDDRGLANIVHKAGGNSIRPTLPETFVDTWGYKVRLSEFQHYATTLGMKEITCFIEGPTEAHRDKTVYPGSNSTSKIFSNLYEPIWRADGTVNPTNYYANYVYNLVQTYGPYIKNWEVINEPDIGNNKPEEWLTRAPLPNEMENVKAPFFHYIRMLRITWEVVKKYNPEDHVTPGGIGHSNYLDALLRYTDNPNGGAVSSQYPNKGGAYFDMVSYHVYPAFFLRVWDNSIGGFRYLHNSDYAAAQVINHKNGFESVLQKYGYNGTTYPKKHYIISETNISRRTAEWRYSSDEMQRNFGIKALVLAQKNGIKQVHIYGVGENINAPSAAAVSSSEEYGLMGIYENLRRDAPGSEKLSPLGRGFKTTAQLLMGYTYDAGQTAALNLPAGVEGGAFRKDGDVVYVLWAKNPNDKTENYSQPFSFPAALNITKVTRFEWDYATTGTSTQQATTGLMLNTAPSFFKPGIGSVTKQNQIITFPAIGTKTVGTPAFALQATSSSGLPVSFNVVSGPATLTGNTITLTGAGTVTIEATQSGNTTFNAAPTVKQIFEVTAASTTPGVTRIEAEKYTSMSGVQVENTTDEGGGQNVGYLDAGDWMNYSVNLNAAGTYTMNFRIAAGSATQFDVRSANGTLLRTVDVPATGGWQIWRTVSVPVPLVTGIQSLQIYARKGGWNINWLEVGGITNGPVIPTTSVITFNALPKKTVGDAAFELAATSTNTATPITFTSSNAAVVLVSNASGKWMATVVSAGTATITASQLAGGSFTAALPVSQQQFVMAPAPSTGQTETRIKVTSVSANPNTGQNYTPWLNDNLGDLVVSVWGQINMQYVDVTLALETRATITRVSLYDHQGTFPSNPVTVYALNGSERTLIGTFTGETYLNWVNMKPAQPLVADAILIRKYGNNIPQKVQVYGYPATQQAITSINGSVASAQVGEDLATNAVNWSVYPNPTSDKIQVQLGHQIMGEVAIYLADAAGKKIKTLTLKKGEEELLQTVSLEKLPSGLYFIQVKANALNEVRKVIKQ